MEESESIKVLITTSGIGSRLGDKTKFTNKCLVRVGDKPTISHIIDSYPSNTEFVITLGHHGKFVKDYLELVYPARKFIFVEVDKYKGKGSSLLYSMLKAECHLQSPFIFHAGDTIIVDPERKISNNWIVGNKREQSNQYRTLKVQDEKVVSIEEKGEINPEFIYTGVCGIRDYEQYWLAAREIYSKNLEDSTLSDGHALRAMLQEGVEFEHHEKEFFDTGNVSELFKTRTHFGSSVTVLDKLEEDTFLVGELVVKFFHNNQMAADRINRAEKLFPCVPAIAGKKDNFYSYEYVPGELFSENINVRKFENFLAWSKENLWTTEDRDIGEECENFYYKKSMNRIREFIDKNDERKLKINGIECKPALTLLKECKDRIVGGGICSRIHGDFILDNVIQKQNNDFTLIDWRQNFGKGVYDYGDIYYDFAKLNHNLVFNHSIVDAGGFHFGIKNDEIEVDINRKNILHDCQEIFFKFLRENNYDLEKVKILTSVVWLNMSPLHEHPIDKFLFYFGKYNLHRGLYDF